MITFDLYGISVRSFDDARDMVQQAVGRALKAHESSHHCGDYWRLDLDDGASIILQKNYDAFEGEWTEESFKDYPYLLYVSRYAEADGLNVTLEKSADLVKRLRRTSLP